MMTYLSVRQGDIIWVMMTYLSVRQGWVIMTYLSVRQGDAIRLFVDVFHGDGQGLRHGLTGLTAVLAPHHDVVAPLPLVVQGLVHGEYAARSHAEDVPAGQQLEGVGIPGVRVQAYQLSQHEARLVFGNFRCVAFDENCLKDSDRRRDRCGNWPS